MSTAANNLFGNIFRKDKGIDPSDGDVEKDGIRKGRQKKPASPYLDGRREWNAQFGRQIAEKNSWRWVALLCLVISILSIGGLLTLGASKKVIPFVAVVDVNGSPIGTAYSSVTTTTDPRIVRSMISDYFKNFRSVTTDGYAQKERIKRVYSMLSAQDPAYSVMNEYFSTDTNDPFTRAKTVTVSIRMSSILPLSKNTYQVEWEEDVRNKNGVVIQRDEFQSAITIKQSTQLSGQEMLDNPLGLYVVEITWTRRL